MTWPSNTKFKFKPRVVVVTLFTCGIVLAGVWVNAENNQCSTKQRHCYEQSFSAFDYLIDKDAHFTLKSESIKNSNVSVVRKMFGPRRSKPTAFLTTNILGNFEPKYHNNRSGPGENGEPVFLSGDQIEVGRKSTEEYGLNDEVSKLIAMDRTVPDARPEECKYWNYETDLPSASVIVIFHNEGFHTLMRTVHSIKNNSPARYLKEIIMVDDYSDKEALKENLENYIKEHFGSLVRLHRTTQREGCMRARTIGAKLATGQAVVFMDGHCECNKNWLVPLLARVAYDPTIMAVPVPDGIDQDTLKYITFYQPGGRHGQGLFEWGLQYKENYVPDEYLKRREHYSEPYWSPTMQGYSMALNRDFFLALGAFDPGLEIWGGEQFELSFKVWQCGGSVEWVPCSHVAHVFRRKRAYGFGKFDIRRPTIQANLKRVVEVWMDPEYREYFYTRHPDMRDYPVGDLTEQLAIKKRLQCKSFKYFMDNFGAGVLKINPPLPKNVAWGEVVWKDGTVDYCWEKQARVWESTETDIIVAKCSGWRNYQMFRFNAKGQLAVDVHCVVSRGDILRIINCPIEPTGDFQYEPVTRFVRHVPTNKCVEGDEAYKELRLRDCNQNEINQKWKVREVYPDVK